MECCINHCRDWRETQGGKFKPSQHAPSCENYKPERFAKLIYDELGSFICEINQVNDYLVVDRENGEHNAILITDVYLTRDQFEKLADFQGF